MGDMINNYTPENEYKGYLAREAFIKAHKANFNNCIYLRTKKDSPLDWKYHIDLMIIYPDGTIESYDIKDNMVIHSIYDECFTIELQNNNGIEGSLYGRQQYFSVQHKNCDEIFWKFNRKLMADWLNNGKIKDEFVDNLNDAVYKKYKRIHQNKDDVLTLVPIKDVMCEVKVSQLIYTNYD